MTGDDLEDVGQGGFDVLLAPLVGFAGSPDRILYVRVGAFGCLPEAQQARLGGHFGKKQQKHVEVILRHGENVVGPLEQTGADRLAADAGNVDALVFQHLDGVRAGRLAATGAEPGGANLDAIPGHAAQKPFGHRAAADIASADEEDVFHGFAPCRASVMQRRTKST